MPACRPVLGLIFLFKWRQETDSRETKPPDQAPVWFARQVSLYCGSRTCTSSELSQASAPAGHLKRVRDSGIWFCLCLLMVRENVLVRAVEPVQAIVGILFNRPQISLGPELSAFREFTEEFTPELKGAAAAAAGCWQPRTSQLLPAELTVMNPEVHCRHAPFWL